jgi:hypothetical protein
MSFTFLSNYNLISIEKLVHYLDYRIIVDKISCMIQEIPTSRMIGAANYQRGLYMISKSDLSTNDASVTCSFTNCNSDIWHLRFAHVPYDKHLVLHKYYDAVTSINTKVPCDICQFARQKRIQFQNSSHISAAIFDLLHIDIWGPNSHVSMQGHRYFLTIVDDLSRHT